MTDKTNWSWNSIFPAPAKLNLFLHVIGRRDDGYHTLQTLFRFVDYGDSLRFSPRNDSVIRLVTPLPDVPCEDNLIVRAARRLQTETGCRKGVDIDIVKRLPMGGGLGGGSSNAATALLALNHLWQLGIPRQRLQNIGLELGADVPVFVYGRNAFAEGLGEALQAVDLPPAWYVVLEPPVHVPTAAVFNAPELKRNTAAIHAVDWKRGFGVNDLEAVTASRFPAVAEHLRWLSAFGEARMTGSGACVFVELARPETAHKIIERLPSDMRGWVAAGLDRHPLFELAS